MPSSGFYKFGYALASAAVVAAIQIKFGLGELVLHMTGPFLSEPALMLGLAGFFGLGLLALLQIFHFDEKLAARFDFRRLRIDFSVSLSGCRVPAKVHMHTGGPTDVVFYRLWVRPPSGGSAKGCTGKLVDIMESMNTNNLYSFWTPERLSLAWATHGKDPVTTIDLTNDHGEFLDLFFVTKQGELFFGTPHFRQPSSLDFSQFKPGQVIFLRVSVHHEGARASDVFLELVWPKSFDVEIKFLFRDG